ncbi:hypothetical protein [Deinococcus aquatilis]|jgi:hypothetical protein|uniref:hypothetical protein n=1 Tax=Deinococcus aquatilis TaxID=519440 RepID=UPI0012F9B4B7|nr:hypothetical protein [Deinococcus aquatilis]
MTDSLSFIDKILNAFPEFAKFRDVYWDDEGNDTTPVCIDLSRFADYAWSRSLNWVDDDFNLLWRIILDLLNLKNQHIYDCIDTGFMETLDHKALEESNHSLVERWKSQMPDFAYALSPEWRERRV